MIHKGGASCRERDTAFARATVYVRRGRATVTPASKTKATVRGGSCLRSIIDRNLRDWQVNM